MIDTGDRLSVGGTATGGPRRPRTARIVRYATGYEIALGIGGPDPDEKASAVIALGVEQAHELAHHLLATAGRAEQARQAHEVAGTRRRA